MDSEIIVVSGVKYVREKEGSESDSSESELSKAELSKLEYVMIRTYSAGVFAGYLESREKDEVILRNARRIWYWEGAASLSQLAMEGTSKPRECKFPIPVNKITLLNVIEIIPITEKAKRSIASVSIWSA